MQNHHQNNRRSPPSSAAKPPLPPPLSVSIPPEPTPHLNESPGSSLCAESPLRSDQPEEPSPAVTAPENYFSPLASPVTATPSVHSPPLAPLGPLRHPQQQHIISFNRREDAPPQTGVVYSGERRGKVGVVEREGVVEKVALVVRVMEVVFCLVSFSVMAADKTQGWAGDSFDRYAEYKFCLTVNILGFVCSGFQAYVLAYHLTTGKHVITHHRRYQFDFILDQILAYLLISASSAAATRVNDWQVNWGKDEFTEMASASVSMAFLAFIAFAISSMISGYNLCNRDLS